MKKDLYEIYFLLEKVLPESNFHGEKEWVEEQRAQQAVEKLSNGLRTRYPDLRFHPDTGLSSWRK